MTPTHTPTGRVNSIDLSTDPNYVRRSDGFFVEAGHSPLTVEEEKEARFRSAKHPLPTESRANRGLRFAATGS